MSSLQKTITIALLIGTMAISYGQKKLNWDKISALKVAFFTEQLDLTSAEAQEFWPIYNAYEKERHTMHKKRYQKRNKNNSIDSLTNAEANDLLERYFKFEQKKLYLTKTYLKKVNKIISSKKTYILIRLEEKFRQRLIRQYRHKKKS